MLPTPATQLTDEVHLGPEPHLVSTALVHNNYTQRLDRAKPARRSARSLHSTRRSRGQPLTDPSCPTSALARPSAQTTRWCPRMDNDVTLLVGSRRIANGRVQSVTLQPIVGAYELILPPLSVGLCRRERTPRVLPSMAHASLSNQTKANRSRWDSHAPNSQATSSANRTLTPLRQASTSTCSRPRSPRWRRYATLET